MKKVCYVVWIGKVPGIYNSWTDTELQVKNFKGAKFKGFADHASAEEAFKKGWQEYIDFTLKPKETEKAEEPTPEKVEEFPTVDYSHILAPGEVPW
jgi:ribonuclease HI